MNDESRNVCAQPGCGGAMIDVPTGEAGPTHIKTRCEKCGHEGSRPVEASEFTEGSALPEAPEKYPFTK